MNTKTVFLYGQYRVHAPENSAGFLTCILPYMLDEMSKNRVRPAVLIIPGGGYGEVSDREAEPVALQFAARGYAAFILKYSVAPHRFPTALREAAMAMRFIRENAQDWLIDPNKIAAIGFSAGAHLCGTLGTMYDCPEVQDIADAATILPDALGLCYPVAVSWGKTHEGSFKNLCGEDLPLRQRLSLDKLVRADMPPVFLWHTRTDAVVPVRNSLVLADALDAAGVPFALHIYNRGPHGLSVINTQVYREGKVPACSADTHSWVGSMLGFFEEMGLKITDLPATEEK